MARRTVEALREELEKVRAKRARLDARETAILIEVGRRVLGEVRAAKPPGKRGAPAVMQNKVLAYLGDHPRAPRAEMAERIYGNRDDASIPKVALCLDKLRRKGKVRRVGVGLWEVIPDAAS